MVSNVRPLINYRLIDYGNRRKHHDVDRDEKRQRQKQRVIFSVAFDVVIFFVAFEIVLSFVALHRFSPLSTSFFRRFLRLFRHRRFFRSFRRRRFFLSHSTSSLFLSLLTSFFVAFDVVVCLFRTRRLPLSTSSLFRRFRRRFFGVSFIAFDVVVFSLLSKWSIFFVSFDVIVFSSPSMPSLFRRFDVVDFSSISTSSFSSSISTSLFFVAFDATKETTMSKCPSV